MASVQTFLLTDANGLPLTTATPTFTDYRDRSGNARTPPANPVHLQGGVYAFYPSNSDENVGTVALVDAGATAFPRRTCFAIYLTNKQNQFWAFAVEDQGGALWTGAPPTVGFYMDSAGANRASPGLVVVAGAYLFAMTPSTADMTAQTQGRIDFPAMAALTYLFVFTDFTTTGAAPSVAGFSPALSSAIAKTTALSFQVTSVNSFSKILVFANFPNLGLYEVVHDDDAFSTNYPSYLGNVKTAISGGFVFSVLRREGWPGSPQLVVVALASDGAVNAVSSVNYAWTLTE